MSFTVLDTPSGAYYYKGKLTQRKLALRSKRQLLLCLPATTDDIQSLHDDITLELALGRHSENTPEQLEDAVAENLEIYGHLALAAISTTPLLIIGSSAKTFIHFSQISG